MNDEVVVPSIGMALMGSGPVTPSTAPHWKAAAEGVFTVPTCEDCGTNYWPLVYTCYACGSLRWSWKAVPGTGRVFTYTWCDAPTHPTGRLENLAVIELDGTVGEPVRVPGWVVGVDRTTLACDLAVEAEFDTVAPDVAVPHWKPRA